ncbi:MAG: hypothetical protein ACT4OS_01670 [Acidimicrobiales bacterium]
MTGQPSEALAIPREVFAVRITTSCRLALGSLASLTVLMALPATAEPASTATPAAAANKAPKTKTKTFANAARIAITEPGEAPHTATPYPSPISVSGVKGTITDVDVTPASVTATSAT